MIPCLPLSSWCQNNEPRQNPYKTPYETVMKAATVPIRPLVKVPPTPNPWHRTSGSNCKREHQALRDNMIFKNYYLFIYVCVRECAHARTYI